MVEDNSCNRLSTLWKLYLQTYNRTNEMESLIQLHNNGYLQLQCMQVDHTVLLYAQVYM